MFTPFNVLCQAAPLGESGTYLSPRQNTRRNERRFLRLLTLLLGTKKCTAMFDIKN